MRINFWIADILFMNKNILVICMSHKAPNFFLGSTASWNDGGGDTKASC